MTTTLTPTSDRIEEQVLLPAPRARVWRALTNAEELGAWFGANLAGATIAPGASVVGNFTIPGVEHVKFDAVIEEMVPEQRFAWRWHPHAIDTTVDFSAEPRTLVTFTLEDAPGGGTLLRVVETGFDAIPAARRESAFRGNSGGWRAQLQKRLPAYLAAA
ncbi:MAG TPA: SRPBCC family protein [Longimicrobium sp.]